VYEWLRVVRTVYVENNVENHRTPVPQIQTLLVTWSLVTLHIWSRLLPVGK